MDDEQLRPTRVLAGVAAATVGALALFERFEAMLPALAAWTTAHLILATPPPDRRPGPQRAVGPEDWPGFSERTR